MSVNVIVGSIVLAQCFCNLGVLTTVNLWHGVEESIWMLTFLHLNITLTYVYIQLVSQQEQGVTHFISRFILFNTLYISYMALVDIPMYINRYLYNPMENKALGLVEGLYDAAQCKLISQDIRHWAQEIPWMSAYFSIAVWFSLYMVTYKPIIKLNKNKVK